jgi:hypothetical protein
MASMLAPDQITAPISPEIAAEFARSSARMALRRRGNRLLNGLRRRSAFNEIMDLSPDIREDVCLTPQGIAERLLAVACDEEEPLPGLAPALSLVWHGLVIHGDRESRRCWEMAMTRSRGGAAPARP